MNQYWKQWDRISQIKNGKVNRISSVSIEIEKISQRLGDGIGPQVKIQKFLDSMHPELRLRVEPSIDRTKSVDWKAIVAQAEKEDDALYQAGKYGRESGKYNSTSAIQTWPPKNSNKKPGQQHQGQNKRYPRRTGDEKKYQERRKKGLCYFCGKPGHMIGECRAKKQKEAGQTISTNSTMLEIEDPPTVEEYLETCQTRNHINGHQMIVNLSVDGHTAKVLLDTGTVGTNLMSLNWAQTNSIRTTKLAEPQEIRMATKGSRATANYSAKADIDIGKGRKITEAFLLVPVGSYDIILGMPFMVRTRIILDPAEGTATFRDHGHSLRCAATHTLTPKQLVATAAAENTTTPPNEQELSTEDDEGYWSFDSNESYGTFRNEISKRTTNEPLCSTAQIRPKIPDFEKEFPTVFPTETPMVLPPLRPGLNHRINLDESRKDQFRNEYRTIPTQKLGKLQEWLKEWEDHGVAVRSEANYACPIFGVPKKQPGEIRWVMDLKERNKITQRDYTPIPNQAIIREDVASRKFRSKLDMSNSYYQIRIEPEDEKKNTITAGHLGAWMIKVMLQGDCNAPATMMRIMNTVLAEFLGKFVWVYLDDILIFSDSEEEHIDHL